MSGSGEAFLSRWSRRKLEAREAGEAPAEPPVPAADAAVPAAAPADAAPEPERAPLPAVDTLTPQSDFTPFMGAEVPLETRQAALKKLFADSYFNVPDPFEAYMEDYTREDPIPIGMLRTLDHARQVLMRDEPPPAEGAAQGEEAAAAQAAADDAAPAPANGAGDGPARQDA